MDSRRPSILPGSLLEDHHNFTVRREAPLVFLGAAGPVAEPVCSASVDAVVNDSHLSACWAGLKDSVVVCSELVVEVVVVERLAEGVVARVFVVCSVLAEEAELGEEVARRTEVTLGSDELLAIVTEPPDSLADEVEIMLLTVLLVEKAELVFDRAVVCWVSIGLELSSMDVDAGVLLGMNVPQLTPT